MTEDTGGAATLAAVAASIDGKTRKKIDWLMRRAEGVLLPPTLLAAEAAHLAPDEARARLGDLAAARPELALSARLARLDEAAAGGALSREYVERYGCAGVRRFAAPGGVTIFLLTVETFPHHVNNVYLIVEPGHLMLFDVGSGLESSRRDLSLGFAIVREVFGEGARYEAVDTAIISHAHIDHFGGVGDIKIRTAARVCVHELDARVLSCFDERVVIAVKDVEVFLRRAGVSDAELERLLSLYKASRDWFKPVEVDRALRDGDLIGGGHRVIHTPGHCPGQICLLVGDVLLTSDHVLSRITPHQFPQAITAFGGLEHYFHSLARVRRLELVNLALGGHEEPIPDLRARVDEIAAFHRERLQKVRELCSTPRTIIEVAAELFGPQEGYGTILAIEEAGAHVEYLHALGKLRVANLEEVAASRDPVFRYERR
jgi:glyoxylase-like metal-dependent hydrolase (beta-lactamase superfamily II)